MIEILISTGEVCEMVTISPSDSAHRLMSTYRPNALGSGVSRDVYKLSDALVLKVANGCSGYGIHDNANANEIALWESLSEDERNSGTFARIFAYSEDAEWIISELIPFIGEGWGSRSADNMELIRKYNVTDLHGDNYGQRHDGSFAILDYGANSEGSAGTYREPCECCECSCQECWPEGCQCEPFEGCHYHEYRCEVCSVKADAADRLAHCADLPTVARDHARDVARAYRGNYACQTARVLWSGDTSEAYSVKVCEDCADAEDERRRLADGPGPDMAQGILEFPNRYVVGLEIRPGRWNGNARELIPFYLVRDRLIVDNVGAANIWGMVQLDRRGYGRPVTIALPNAEGLAGAQYIAAKLNAGEANDNAKQAPRIARL